MQYYRNSNPRKRLIRAVYGYNRSLEVQYCSAPSGEFDRFTIRSWTVLISKIHMMKYKYYVVHYNILKGARKIICVRVYAFSRKRTFRLMFPLSRQVVTSHAESDTRPSSRFTYFQRRQLRGFRSQFMRRIVSTVYSSVFHVRRFCVQKRIGRTERVRRDEKMYRTPGRCYYTHNDVIRRARALVFSARPTTALYIM